MLIKVPGTPPGLTAMERLVADGIGVNVTLLFSLTHYLQTADAYQRALERRAAASLPLDVPSVASVFVSRWDAAADPLLPAGLHGRLGLAVTEKIYAAYRALLDGPRWQALAAAGPVRNGCCGRRRRPRIPPSPTRTTSAGWPPRRPSTRFPRRPCWPSPTTAARSSCCSRTPWLPNAAWPR